MAAGLHSAAASNGVAPAGAPMSAAKCRIARSGYTTAPTLSFTDNSGTGSGVTATAVLSSLLLAGTGDTIGGSGNITINAVVRGTSGFTTSGTGTGVLTSFRPATPTPV